MENNPLMYDNMYFNTSLQALTALGCEFCDLARLLPMRTLRNDVIAR